MRGKMRLQFFLSCLLGTSILISAPVSANFGSHLPPSGAPPGDSEDVRRLTDPRPFVEPVPDFSVPEAVKQPPADDDDMAGEELPAGDVGKSGSPTRLERAKLALAESNAPGLSEHEICTTLVAVARANALPVGFFANLIWRESAFDRVAISRVGAMGIAQFMPDVADKLGLNAFDARYALPASGSLLRTLRSRFGNLGLVAAAYNAGPKKVADWLQQRSALPQETRDYVGLITGRPVEEWREAKQKTVVFNVPRRVPCHRVAAFSAVENAERAEQTRHAAGEEARLQKVREAMRRLKKKPGPARPARTASRRRAT